ncbi:MAG: ABC transporter permease [Lachnospiraceae bacterium]|nr:ABC transporter permease [Lachnospiraceae bacterium]
MIHNFIYGLKGILRERQAVFWAALFPFILGTLFYVSFGDIYERAEQYHEIPAALVIEEENQENQAFEKLLQTVEDEKGTKMFRISRMTKKEAEEALKNEKIDGYYLAGKEISLVLQENGVNQTILHMFLERVQQQMSMVKEVSARAPQNISKLLSAWENMPEFYTEVNQSQGNMDNMLQYFYALIAMSCLFASYLSLDRFSKLQANATAIGARRGVAPIKKSVVVISEFLVCLLIECVIECLLLVYLRNVLGIQLGSRIVYFIPVILLGSSIGIAIGILLGSAGSLTMPIRYGLNTSITLLLSFLSGLMVNIVKQVIEDHLPILNRINPATLIVDSLYSLNVYDSLERYWRNLGILAAMTVFICAASILLTRRMKYASL